MAKSKKILVVEDAKDTLALFKAILEEGGYEVSTAVNGFTGIEKAKKLNPDLIISDIIMPEMDGFVFFKELRKDIDTKHIPVMVITARAKMEDSFKIFGVDSFLTKPINAELFLKEVQRLTHFEYHPHAQQKQKSILSQEPLATGKTSGDDSVPTHQKKVLVFGKDASVGNDIREKFETAGHFPVLVQNEREILSKANMFNPHLVLLELTVEMDFPLPEIVFNLSKLLLKKSQESLESLDPAPIIIYKVEEKASGIGHIGAEIADTGTLVEKCQESGMTKFIGEYSSITFISKIEDFLK